MGISRLSMPIVAFVAGSLLLWPPTVVRVFAGEVDQGCLSDLTQNGPRAWKEVTSFAKNVGVTCKEQRINSTGEGSKAVSQTINARWSLCWNRESSLRYLERRGEDSEASILRVVNPRYRFVVYKRHESDAFQLETGKRAAPGRPQPIDLTEAPFDDFLEAGVRVYGIRLEDILSDKEFRLERVKYIAEPDVVEKRVLVEWQYLGSEAGRTRRAGGVYWAELNPKYSWRVDRAGVRIPAKKEWGDWLQEVAYQQVDANVSFPHTVTILSTSPRTQSRSQFTYTFEKPTTCQRADEEFYLPHYNIPESALGYAQASPWPRILLVGGGIVGLAGFYLLSRRWRKPSGLVA
jgi:hypothetical protein